VFYVYAGWDNGDVVIIEHSLPDAWTNPWGEHTIYSVYLHLTTTINKNDIVQKGQVIGKVHARDDGTASHLHFEIRRYGDMTSILQCPASRTSSVVGPSYTDTGVDPGTYGYMNPQAWIEGHRSLSGSMPTSGYMFAQTGKYVAGRFWEVWQGGRSFDDSLYINGLPISEERDEVSLTNGKTYKTQWFERTRLEYHSENQAPYDVLLGLLGSAAANGRQNETPFKPVPRPGMSTTFGEAYHFDMLGSASSTPAQQAGLQWFPETQHTLGDNSEGGRAIAAFWTQLGGIPQFGYPLSQPFMERNKDDGKTYLVQYFERQRFEYHPENKGTRYEVLLGRLGAEQIGGKTVAATPTSLPQPTSVPPSPTANTVELIRVLTGHTNSVISLDFSPDGQTLASGSYDKTAKLWRVGDGQLIRTITTNNKGGPNVDFSPDGQILAMGFTDPLVEFWRVSDGTMLRSWTAHFGAGISLRFSPDGATLVTGAGFTASYEGDKAVKLWRVSDGTLIRVMEGHTAGIFGVAFSPNGQFLASASDDSMIKIWRVSDGALLRTLAGHSYYVSAVSFSPDNQMLASGGADSTVKLWRVSDGTMLRSWSGNSQAVWSVAFSPDGQVLATGSGEDAPGGGDKAVKLWRVSDGTLLQTLVGHTGSIRSVVFSPDGRTLVSSSSDQTIRLWRVR
jgi:hypothetical protein